MQGAGTLAAFALPGAAFWAAVGAALALPGIHAAARWAAIGFAIVFGGSEVAGWRLRAPTSGWQVPFSWVRRRPGWIKIVIWGGLLGPGVITRNPYPSVWMLPLLLASFTSLSAGVAAGLVVGVLQGGARAAGILREQWAPRPLEFQTSLLAHLRWQPVDGATLLAAGTLLLVLST